LVRFRFVAACRVLGFPSFSGGRGLELVESPAFQQVHPSGESDGPAVDDRSTSTASDPARVEELLVEQLQDIAHGKDTAQGAAYLAAPDAQSAECVRR
jgi:hypothetical protein